MNITIKNDVKNITIDKIVISIWLFAYITGIPYKAIPIVPLSMLLVIITFRKRLKFYFLQYDKYIRHLLLGIIFLILIRFYILYFIGEHNEIFNPAHIVLFINIIIFGYIASRGLYFLNWTIKLTVFIFIISMLFHLGYLFVGSPFVEISHFLYGRFILESQGTAYIQFMARGLTAWPHVFGYHMVYLFTFILVHLFERDNFSFRLILILIGSYISLLFLGERACVFSISVSIIGYFLFRVKKIFILNKFVVISGIILILFLILSTNIINWHLKTPLLFRIQDYQLKIERTSRIELQFLTLVYFVKHPFGFGLSRNAWINTVLNENPAIFSTWGKEIAPHNGYFTFALPFGFIGLLGVIFLLYYIFRVVFYILNFVKHRLIYSNIIIPTIFSFIALFLQALWHNSSLFSLEQATTLSLFFLSAYFSIISKKCNLYERKYAP